MTGSAVAQTVLETKGRSQSRNSSAIYSPTVLLRPPELLGLLRSPVHMRGHQAAALRWLLGRRTLRIAPRVIFFFLLGSFGSGTS